MKYAKLFGCTVLLLVVLNIAACAPKVGTPISTSVLPSEAVSTTVQVTATSATDAATLIIEKLQDHHDIERIYSAQKTLEEWNATLDRMIGYGAKISEEEKQIIIDYLMSLQ